MEVKMEDGEYWAKRGKWARSWGAGPWQTVQQVVRFTTRAGYRAFVRQDALYGHLHCLVAVSNPQHPALKKKPASLGGREVNYLDETCLLQAERILDPETLSEPGRWLVISLGYRGDLLPLSPTPGDVYRDMDYAKNVCEELGELLSQQWNDHLLETAERKRKEARKREEARKQFKQHRRSWCESLGQPLFPEWIEPVYREWTSGDITQVPKTKPKIQLQNMNIRPGWEVSLIDTPKGARVKISDDFGEQVSFDIVVKDK